MDSAVIGSLSLAKPNRVKKLVTDHPKPARSAYVMRFRHIHSPLLISDVDTVNMSAPAKMTPAVTVIVDGSPSKAIPRKGVTTTEILDTALVLDASTESMPK